MRIIHIGNVGLRANGVGQVIENLSSAQIELGHEVLVLTAREKKEQLARFHEIHKINEFYKLIDDFNPDIFIFHSLYIWEYIKFYPYLLKKKIPYLIQLHGALSKENYKKNFLKKWIANKVFYNKFIKAAKAIIYLNNNEYEQSIVKDINPSSLFIPNGCPRAHIYPKIKNKDKKVEILYLGRIDFHHKGLDKLIEAIRILNNENLFDKVHFSIFGFGEETEMNRIQNELSGLQRIAHFFGPVYGDKKYEIYNKSDMFILTSRYEGMPMGVLEALSYGLPCIITKATNMQEIIQQYDCGYLTEFNSSYIANTIKLAIKEFKKNYDKLQNNSLIASHQFLWSKIGEESINLYSKFITHDA